MNRIPFFFRNALRVVFTYSIYIEINTVIKIEYIVKIFSFLHSYIINIESNYIFYVSKYKVNML